MHHPCGGNEKVSFELSVDVPILLGVLLGFAFIQAVSF